MAKKKKPIQIVSENLYQNGYPLKITDLVAQLPGAAYVTRQSVHTAAAVRRARKAIRKAFELSEKNIGTCFVEIVSTCNSGWKMTPVESNDWMVKHMFPLFPIGDLKDGGKDATEPYNIKG